MKFYFAPMEGITGYVFRNAHHACFPSVRYVIIHHLYLPNQNRSHRAQRKNRDVLPENNRNIPLIPQVLYKQCRTVFAGHKGIGRYGL